MQEIFPRFYSFFRCIANRCEDSCCKDWDIDIDSKTEAFYQSVQGLTAKQRRFISPFRVSWAKKYAASS